MKKIFIAIIITNLWHLSMYAMECQQKVNPLLGPANIDKKTGKVTYKQLPYVLAQKDIQIRIGVMGPAWYAGNNIVSTKRGVADDRLHYINSANLGSEIQEGFGLYRKDMDIQNEVVDASEGYYVKIPETYTPPSEKMTAFPKKHIELIKVPWDTFEIIKKIKSDKLAKIPTSPGDHGWIHAAVKTNCLDHVKNAFPQIRTSTKRMSERANQIDFTGHTPLYYATLQKNDPIINYIRQYKGVLLPEECQELRHIDTDKINNFGECQKLN